MKGLKWELSVYRMDNRGERERIENRIEQWMLLISSWKIESVEWLLSLIKMLDNNETTYSFPISSLQLSYADSFKNCSINVKCNRIWSTSRLFHLIIINIPLESLSLE